ncbi:uncharacterized protein TNCV_541011 [Trichonephila clavipes]|nr:uncharacterized protein TNCV_541011 [Trichonephila clavipes]
MEQSNNNITNAETLTSEMERNLANENGETQHANINDENMQDYVDQQPSEKDIVHPEDISIAPTEKCLENVGYKFENYTLAGTPGLDICEGNKLIMSLKTLISSVRYESDKKLKQYQDSAKKLSPRGNAGLEDLRVKRSKAVESTGTAERDEKKRTKICRKIPFKGSDYEHNKRKTPVPPQGLKRGVHSSIFSRSRKHMRQGTNKNPSQEPEVLPGPSNQGHRRFSPPKEESSRETRVESGKARETRTKDSGGHSAAEGRPVRSTKNNSETLPVLSQEPLHRTIRTTGGV